MLTCDEQAGLHDPQPALFAAPSLVWDAEYHHDGIPEGWASAVRECPLEACLDAITNAIFWRDVNFENESRHDPH